MNLTDKQREELFEKAKPLIKWMAENCHPHCKTIVESTGIELLEGLTGHTTEEFIKD